MPALLPDEDVSGEKVNHSFPDGALFFTGFHRCERLSVGNQAFDYHLQENTLFRQSYLGDD